MQTPIPRKSDGHASDSKSAHSTHLRTAPSLYPVYLPLPTQHKLLNFAQKILEKACYHFGTKSLTVVLHANGWDCVEAGELNIWTQKLRAHEHKFAPEDLKDAGKSFEDLLTSIAELRNTAVHRNRVTAARFEDFMSDAESFCKLLHDENSTAVIAQLRRTTRSTVDDLKRNKGLLERRITATIKDFASRRAEIDRLEKLALAQILAEDRDHQETVGKRLEQAATLLQLHDADANPPAEQEVTTLHGDHSEDKITSAPPSTQRVDTALEAESPASSSTTEIWKKFSGFLPKGTMEPEDTVLYSTL
nr:uncharacterized protein LOC112030589 [Quercus suber]